jgi:hypothetical protein
MLYISEYSLAQQLHALDRGIHLSLGLGCVREGSSERDFGRQW